MYGDVRREDLLSLQPGDSLEVEQSLTESYSMTDGQEYTVSLSSPVLDLVVNQRAVLARHDCGAAVLSYSRPELARRLQPLVFHDTTCSTDEQDLVETVEGSGRVALGLSRTLVYEGSGLYEEWFGPWNHGSAAFVASVLQRIDAEWDAFTGDCDHGEICNGTSGAYAWVQPPFILGVGGDFQRVHLCAPFFSISSAVAVADSQMGTLVHEKTHLASVIFDLGLFTNVTVTDQSHSVCASEIESGCYGPDDARALAVADPGLATHNADNYELFVSSAFVVGVILPVL